MESPESSSGSLQHLQLPPGFRFHPTDEELVVHYLKMKAACAPLPVAIIAEIDLYKFDPWELPNKAVFGEQEWYFFSPRDRKYPNGARPNRAATSGYWKATGTDKTVMTSDNQKVCVKKALVFYGGKPPKGVKTNWIMHEYRLLDSSHSSRPQGLDLPNKKASLTLDDWVLCRIYKKNNTQRRLEKEKDEAFTDGATATVPSSNIQSPLNSKSNKASFISNSSLVINNNNNGDKYFFDGTLSSSSGGATQNESNACSMLPIASGYKRALQNQYWNKSIDNLGSVSSSSKKHFHDHNSRGNQQSNFFASHLNQFPQNVAFHTTSIMGSLSDASLRQQFQLPNINWSS